MSTVERGYLCWRCGVELTELRFPVSRREECPGCRAEIHVCKQCENYDERVADACREDRAEHVSNKESANFCDYFKAKADAHSAVQTGKIRSSSQHAEALFSGADIKDEKQSPEIADTAQKARDELKKLFGE